MHDPQTVAFKIPFPWYRRGPAFKDGSTMRHWEPFITIWHVDPESDGSDDSCGWAYPRFTKKQLKRLQNLGWSESYNPVLQRHFGKTLDDPADAESLLRAAFLRTAYALGVKITADEAVRWACEAAHCSDDGYRSLLAFLPGWHSNREEDSQEARRDHANGLFFACARRILQEKRPRWRHPRWHVWHWRIQVHTAQQFKRWAFSRCCECGRGFTWGYAPTTNNWHGTGPLWFRSEKGVFHGNCDSSLKQTTGKANA
jgi:hypothetical protein